MPTSLIPKREALTVCFAHGAYQMAPRFAARNTGIRHFQVRSFDELKARAASAGVAERITWHGAQPHARVLAELDAGDLFVLPANIARDNDRDGIPNAILEAQGRAVPILACDVGGVSEAVKDKATGRLTTAGDAAQLAARIEELIKDPAQRAKLGNAGYASVSEKFDAEAGYDRIAALLRREIG